MIEVYIMVNGKAEAIEVDQTAQRIVIDLQKFADARDLEILPKGKIGKKTSKRDISTALIRTLNDLNRQILEVGKIAEHIGVEPCQIRASGGELMLTPLLAAKAQALAGLAHIHGGAQ